MQAEVGDRIVVHSVHVGEAVREGEVLEVRGEGGGPPYRVRWCGTGQEALLHPGAGATIRRAPPGAAGRS